MVAAVGAAVAAVFSMRACAQKGLAPSCLAVLHPYGSPPAFFEATAGADRPASGRIWSPSPPPQLPTVARLAGALGHRRAALDGDARQPRRHATPPSKARRRHQLHRRAPLCRCHRPPLACGRRGKKREKVKEQMKLGFGARADERCFCAVRA